MTSSTTGKIDKELYLKKERLYPTDSFEEFLEWSLYELKAGRLRAKHMKVTTKEYREAAYYSSYIFNMLGKSEKTFIQHAKDNKIKIEQLFEELSEEELKYD